MCHALSIPLYFQPVSLPRKTRLNDLSFKIVGHIVNYLSLQTYKSYMDSEEAVTARFYIRCLNNNPIIILAFYFSDSFPLYWYGIISAEL